MGTRRRLFLEEAAEIATGLTEYNRMGGGAGLPLSPKALAERVRHTIAGVDLAIQAPDYFPIDLRQRAKVGVKVLFRIDHLLNSSLVVGHWEGAETGFIDVESEFVLSADLYGECPEAGQRIALHVVRRLFDGKSVLPSFAIEKTTERTVWLSWLRPVEGA